jgi:acetyl esterase/lipase
MKPEEPLPGVEDRAALRELVNRPVVYAVDGVDRVSVRSDLVYKTDGALELKMDVYRPETAVAGESLPAVLFIHGGVPPEIPVRPKAWGIFKSWGRLVAASGMAGVTFNHRLGFPDPNLVTASADVLEAIAFVRRGASRLGIDPERMALVVYSGGGPLLSTAIRNPEPQVRCLAAFYAYLDLTGSAVHRKFLTPEQIDWFSPTLALSHSSLPIPPIFVARAGRDQVPDLLPGLDRFVLEAISRNASLAFFNQPGGQHGFDNQPGDPRSVEIVREAVEFLRRNLEPR